MKNATIVWGISKWRDFEACPAMFAAKHVRKNWKDSPSPQMERGRKIHTAMEEGIKYDISLEASDEPALVAFEPVRTHVMGLTEFAKVETERKIGVSRDFKAVDFFRGPNLWVRGALDVLALGEGQALVIDWKTGRYKPEHQVDAVFYGAIVEHLFGVPTTVQYHYLDNPEISFGVDVTDGLKVLENWRKKFDFAEAQIAGGEIEYTPGHQCRWCGYAACPHNRNEKLK